MSLSQTRSSKLTMNAKGVVVELFDMLISHLKCGWVRIDGPESRWYYFSTFILILQKLKKLKKTCLIGHWYGNSNIFVSHENK